MYVYIQHLSLTLFLCLSLSLSLFRFRHQAPKSLGKEGTKQAQKHRVALCISLLLCTKILRIVRGAPRHAYAGFYFTLACERHLRYWEGPLPQLTASVHKGQSTEARIARLLVIPGSCMVAHKTTYTKGSQVLVPGPNTRGIPEIRIGRILMFMWFWK